ncbi:ribonuclease E inhibitor RraB [Pseudocolwellia sp. HL-MZ19]|uniref:ribonuclease E inhibitor RraB n=1 Tax=unclassified Pseudocolwellia TaxID=2848178 RepID=UPI003CEB8E45
MERDLTLFPQDEIGEYLWDAVSTGNDLSQEREIEFTVIFKSHELALKFGHLLLENNQKLSLCPFDENTDYPWEVTAYPFISALYENIIAYRHLLTESSAPFEGVFDGFYFQVN